jgi:hypothetical protein
MTVVFGHQTSRLFALYRGCWLQRGVGRHGLLLSFDSVCFTLLRFMLWCWLQSQRMAITGRQKNSKKKCRVEKHEREQIFVRDLFGRWTK